jgi:hypothetical protein
MIVLSSSADDKVAVGFGPAEDLVNEALIRLLHVRKFQRQIVTGVRPV